MSVVEDASKFMRVRNKRRRQRDKSRYYNIYLPLYREILAKVLQGRPQTVDEIAAAALFLVSDAASAITGQTLNVDGGMAFY